MIDLLKRFVELAPQEWGADLSCSDQCEDQTPEEAEYYVLFDFSTKEILLSSDHTSAEAIIFLWDYLEGEGWFPSISSTEDGPTFEMVSTGETNEFEYVTWNLGHTPTRIEALVRACVAYWRNNDG